MADRSTKTLLLLIAIGIWGHLLLAAANAPVASEASVFELHLDVQRLGQTLSGLRSDVEEAYSDINSIAFGQCHNQRIC